MWNNVNRVNHANQFVPRSVQINAGRSHVNSVRTNVNTGRQNINSVGQKVNSVKPKINSGYVDTFRPKQPVANRPQVKKYNQRNNFAKSHSPVRRPIVKNTAKMSNSYAVKGHGGSAVKA